MEIINAVNFAPFPQRGVLGSEDAKRSLAAMREDTGASHVILTPPGIQGTPQSEEIVFGEYGPEDGELRSFIAFARSLGLKVILKPTVNCENGVWRAFINFFDKDVCCEPKWSVWFAAHERFQLHYAKIAEESGCVMFITGCEMVMAERRESQWRDLVAKVKRVFSGPVSYNTDKYQEDNVAWWDCVDVISSSGYYPVGAWETQLDRIERVVKKYGKPFFFAETGCMSTSGSPNIPNKWDLRGEPDAAGQAAWYRDMFARCKKRSWVEGFGLWSWPWQLPPAETAAKDSGYSLCGKPACTIVKEHFVTLAPAECPCGVPLRGRKPFGFSSHCESCPDLNPTPILAENQRQAGRIPSCGGCASPSGAQCRRMTVFCLPGTMTDRGGMNR